MTTLAGVRLSQFRSLLRDEFGEVRGSSLARDHVFAELDGRSAEQAIEAGIDPKRIWEVICVAYDVPADRRLGRDD